MKFPFAYFFLCLLLYLLCLPILFLLSLKQKYRHSIPARFFLKNFKLQTSPQYWFHACSLGECKSYEPLLLALLKQEQSAQILLTCTTTTGFEALQKISKHSPQNFEIHYLPFEIFLPLWHFKRLKTLVVTEAELWKMLFFAGKKAQAQTILLNARISDRSLKSYQKLAWFYRSVFALIDWVLPQSLQDERRLQALGAKQTLIFPNLKVFSTPKTSHSYTKSSSMIVAASTHQGEEELILQAYLDSNSQSKLLVVPRHPERFAEVKKLLQSFCQNHNKKFSTFTQEWGEVVLVDKMGELNNLFAIADCVILGGSFVPVGGHNPLEPAFFHAPILTGEHIFNQRALFALVEGYQITTPTNLKSYLCNLDTLPQTQIKDFNCKMQDLISIILGNSNAESL